jgi:hypothetical protein
MTNRIKQSSDVNVIKIRESMITKQPFFRTTVLEI